MTANAKHGDCIAKTCRGCGLLCDDVSIELTSGKLKFANLCSTGESWYQSRLDQSRSAGCLVAGRTVSSREATAAVAKTLGNSRAAVFAGLEWLDTRSQQSVVDLVRKTGGFVSPAVSECNSAGLKAFQRYGRATCTLGEIGRHKGLVCFWNVGNAEVPPRLIEKYLAESNSVWNISPEKNADIPGASKLGERFSSIYATRKEQLHFIRQLRSKKAGNLTDNAGSLKTLFEQFQEAEHITFFVDKGKNDGPDPVMDGLHQLARSLNAVVPSVILELGAVANSGSAREVLGWSTGQFSSSCFVPESGAAIESGGSLRDRLFAGDYDLAVIFDSQFLDEQVVATLSDRGKRKLICLDSAESGLTKKADILIRISETGWNHGGDFFRLDGIPIAIDPLVTSDRINVREVVDGVLETMNGVHA